RLAQSQGGLRVGQHFLDVATFADGHPHALYKDLRETLPVYWNPEPNGPGFWALTRYADVYAVDHDFQNYSSGPTIMIPDPPPGQTGALGEATMMLMMDPPLDDGRELYKLTEIIHSAPETLPPGAGGQAVGKMFAYGMQVIAEKRARPADDLATRLLQAEVDGKRLTDPEFLLFFLLLIDAGGDTTRNLLSAGLLALHENPDQLAWLMADLPARLPSAREELLRYNSPVIYMRRTATRDTRIGETAIKGGDKVVMYFGAANRDPEKFDRPDALDLSRDPNEHIAFG